MRKERGEDLRRLFLAALLSALVVWRNLFRLDDPDVWYHLKIGEVILKTRSVPRVDIFSYTITGKPWVAFEWLAQVLLYVVQSAVGFSGLTVFKALVVAASYLVFLSIAGVGFWGVLLLGLAGWSSGGLAERPLIFDPLLLALSLRLLQKAESPPYKRLIPLQILWANLHGGAALLGVGAAGAKTAAEAFSRRPVLKWAAAAALGAAAMTVNPRGWEILAHLHSTLTFPGRERIHDWSPLPGLLNAHGLFFLLACVGAALAWREEPFLILVAFGLASATVSSVRNAALFEPVAAVLAARALSRRLPAHGWRPAAGLALASVPLFLQPRSLGHAERRRWAVEFLDQAGLQGRMFNEYQIGGYLIWKGYPNRPVFLDGRGFEYGSSLIDDALHWPEPAAWARLDARWHFDYAVLDNTVDYRARVLDESGEWAPVFWDDACLVYARREPANAEIIQRYGYRFIKPNRLDLSYLQPELKDAKKRAEVLSELDRAIVSSPLHSLAERSKHAVLSLNAAE